jgi:hypothetical protein
MKSKSMRYIPFTLILVLLVLLSSGNISSAVEANAGNYKTAINLDAQTLTISRPDQVTNGDFLLAQITFEKGMDALPVTIPADWNLILTTHAAVSGGNKDIGQSLYWKTASNNEPVAYTWTFGQKVKALGGIQRYTGIDANNPIVASSGRGGEGDATGQNQMNAPELIASTGMKLVGFYGFKGMAILDSPAGMTKLYQAWDEQNSYSVLAVEENILKQGATGERTALSWEYDEPGKSIESEWVAQMVLLRTTGTQTTIPVVEAPTEVKVLIDGVPLTMIDKPFIENGRTLVPMRALFESFGAEVSWDSVNKIALAVQNDITIRIPIGSTRPTVNGITVLIDVPAKIVNGRTYIPLRFVGEFLGYTVGWDGPSKTVTITTQ